MTELLEEFNLMMKKWEVCEQDSKEKGVESNSAGMRTNGDIPVTTQGLGENTEIRGQRDEVEQIGGRIRCLEMPVFNGEDLDGWIFRAERYFNMNHLRNWERVEAAAICFEGETLAWFQWEDSRQSVTS